MSAVGHQPPGVLLRRRRADDVPELARVLLAQQPLTRYPRRDPLPVPAEDFVARATDVAAWVAELDGRLAGHVAVGALTDGEMGQAFASATGMRLERLGCVSTLFVDPACGGRGVAGALLGRAVGWLGGRDLTPVLDVFTDHGRAHELYRRQGWVEVGRLRPAWVPEDASDLVLMMLPARAPS